MAEEAPTTVPPPATPAPAPAPTSTTAGADLIQGNAWLTAGAVVFYSTWALWVKLRNSMSKTEKAVDRPLASKMNLGSGNKLCRMSLGSGKNKNKV